jgi:Zn finger protein HypA/HybF involved in hydrogenase expression
VVVTETIAGLSAIKPAFDMTKALKDINDAAIRNAAVIELQEKLLSAREAQTALLERVSQLEKEVAGFEKWDAEKVKYDLQPVYADTFAYARKPDAGSSEPPHFICANCYEHRKKTILQRADAAHVFCPECKTKIRYESDEARRFQRPISPTSSGWT